jgi:GNAT superfamily N-acetyltransferase
VFSPERLATYEDATLSRGDGLYRLVARHRDSGELAGHTIVAVESRRPAVARQHDTAVARAHRGHRLGVLLKTGMLLWLAEAEPQIETVDTHNAESNDHMIAVNEALGYRVMARSVEFQTSLVAAP